MQVICDAQPRRPDMDMPFADDMMRSAVIKTRDRHSRKDMGCRSGIGKREFRNFGNSDMETFRDIHIDS